MLGELTVTRSGKQEAPWYRPHPRCLTQTQRICVWAGSALALSAVKWTVDEVCFGRWQRWVHRVDSRRTANDFLLTVQWYEGEGARFWEVEGKRAALVPRSFLVGNPIGLHRWDEVRCGKDIGLGFDFAQGFLRAFRDAVGIPRWAGPFDFHAEPCRFPPVLRQEFQRAVKEVFQAAVDDVTLPIHLYAVGMKMMAALWTHHPSRIRQRLNEIHYRFRLDPRLDRAMAYLYRRGDEPCTVRALCREAGVSESNALRLFNQHLGLSPRAFLRRHRVEQAERLLRDSPGLTPAEAAERAGFGSTWALRRAHQAIRGAPAPF